MKTVLPALLALVALGCTNDSDNDSQPEGTPAAAVETSTVGGEAKIMEVGCASCIYKMPGVTGCKLAAKIDGKPVLVTGGKLDAHKSGLCSGVKQATVKGELRGEEFVATEVTLK